MPELPDLVHIEAKLRKALVGHRIAAARTGDPLVLRIMVRAPFPEVLVGRTIEKVVRRGHFICLELDEDLLIVVNLMLAGRFSLVAASDGKAPKALALALEMDDQRELRIIDDVHMAKVYVTPREQAASIPIFGKLGVEILSPAFTEAKFKALIAKRRDQVRQFLMDKETIASVGNAYADEILFEARLHPKTFCSKLSPEDVQRLYEATRQVMRDAVTEIARRDPPIETKLRDFVKVRGKDGKPCPRCGTTLRAVRVGDGDACFCPQCQPTARKLFVDFSKLPKP
jgi:formamidopyrimidine-DNA glycosylase